MKAAYMGLMPSLAIALNLAILTQPAAAQVQVLPQYPPSQHPPSRIKPVGNIQEVMRAHPVIQPSQMLRTRPLSINHMFGAKIRPEVKLNQLSVVIPPASRLVPQPINPAEALIDPGAALSKFFSQPPAEPKALEPLEFFKLPKRDSGMKMNLMNF